MYIVSLILQDEIEYYGIEWDVDGPVSQQQPDESVQVPATQCPLTEAEFSDLFEQISPLENSVLYAVDLYERTVEFVFNRL